MKPLSTKKMLISCAKALGSQLLVLVIVASASLFGSSSVLADHVHEHGHDHHHSHSSAQGILSLAEQARELQREHRFDEAASLLARHIESKPFDLEAQLLHADVLTHAGRIAEARSACIRVGISGSATLAKFCAVQVLLTEGDYGRADKISQALAKEAARLDDAAQVWALEISAEAAWRAGRSEAAAAIYQQLLTRSKLPHSVLDAYQAFLRAQGRG